MSRDLGGVDEVLLKIEKSVQYIQHNGYHKDWQTLKGENCPYKQCTTEVQLQVLLTTNKMKCWGW